MASANWPVAKRALSNRSRQPASYSLASIAFSQASMALAYSPIAWNSRASFNVAACAWPSAAASRPIIVVIRKKSRDVPTLLIIPLPSGPSYEFGVKIASLKHEQGLFERPFLQDKSPGSQGNLRSRSKNLDSAAAKRGHSVHGSTGSTTGTFSDAKGAERTDRRVH